jgi:tetratricopeptide (TPR) repeat protein
MVSIYWHPTSISTGASGAICGLAGALISLFIFERTSLSLQQRRGILFWAVLLMPVGLLSELLFKHVGTAMELQVDTAAHISGLISGFILGAFITWGFHATGAARARYERGLLVSTLGILVLLFSLLIQVRSDVVELGRGERALDRQDPVAIEQIQRFVQRNPDDVIGHGELGYAYDHFGRCVNAETEYRHVLQLQPGNPAAEYDLARIYTYCMNRPGEAVPLFRASLPQLSESSSKYFYFGAALDSIGRTQEAEEIAQKALALDPKSARNHQLLATILTRLGKTDAAAKERKLAEQLRAE